MAAGLTLAAALRAGPGLRLALVGAGGKTTAMAQLARQLPPPVLVTTSTHIGAWQTGFADRHFTITDPNQIPPLAGEVERVCLFTGPAVGGERLAGLDAVCLNALHDLAARLGAAVIVEADGSRQRPLKAPAAHEPAVPAWAEHVVVAAGLSGLGQTLAADNEAVHRPELFARLAGIELGAEVGPDELVRVLLHRQGGLQHIPPGARRSVLLNQARGAGRLEAALAMAGRLLEAYDSVIAAELREETIFAACQPLAGVILAAGESRRLGRPKALLEWRGKPLIRHAAENALSGGITNLVVVTGAVDAPVRDALQGLPARIVHNPDWRGGQSTSLRAGLRAAREAAPRAPGAVIFLLADQPFAGPDLIRALRDRHRSTLSPVIAPFAGGRRANPVLFDQVTFSALEALTGEAGGRAIFDRFPPQALPWHDERILLDVDTPQDYQRLLAVEGGGGE